MISLIAFGVSKYITFNEDIQIPCAFNDAKNVYNTFKKVFRDDFQDFKSLCVDSPTSWGFKLLLSSIKNLYNEEECLFLYFSGHGIKKNDKLFLCFSDYV